MNTSRVRLTIGLAACMAVSSCQGGGNGGGEGGQGGDAGSAEGGAGGTVTAGSGGKAGSGAAGTGSVAGGSAGSSGGGGNTGGSTAGTGGTPPIAGSAGTAPQAMPDAGTPDTAPSIDPSCNAVMCEDFESGALSTRWKKSASGATVAVEETTGARGKYAVHMHVIKGGTTAMIYLKDAPATAKAPLHGRMFVKLTPDHSFPHTYMFRAGSNPNTEWGGNGGKWAIAPASAYSAAGTFPGKKWICVQWEMTENPVALKLSVDGQLQGMGTSSVATMNGWGPMFFGIYAYHPDQQPEIDLWLDDIKLDTKPVPCN